MDVQQQMGIFIFNLYIYILYCINYIGFQQQTLLYDCMIFFAVNFFNFWRSPYGITLNVWLSLECTLHFTVLVMCFFCKFEGVMMNYQPKLHALF